MTRRMLIAGALAAALALPAPAHAEVTYEDWRERGLITGRECGPWTRVCWDAIRERGIGPLMPYPDDLPGRTWLQVIGDTLRCESRFDPNARGWVPGQRGVDRGVAQINSYWWPEIADAQADDPAWAIRWMVQQVVAGHGRWWMCWEQRRD